ncbi:MAG: VanZ family protein [Muribaculaceae bacterium]|nr:VanZ family protein [Muribaculaceae bacterium]
MEDVRMSKVRSVIDKIPAWGCTVATALLILWLTLARKPLGDTDLQLFPGVDKVVHAIMFGWLAAMIVLDYVRAHRWKLDSKILIPVAVLFSSLFGVMIEYAQDLMHQGRSFDIGDIAADWIGAGIAGIIWYLLRGEFNGREKDSR